MRGLYGVLKVFFMKNLFTVTSERIVIGAKLPSDFKKSHAFARNAAHRARQFMPWTACRKDLDSTGRREVEPPD